MVLNNKLHKCDIEAQKILQEIESTTPQIEIKEITNNRIDKNDFQRSLRRDSPFSRTSSMFSIAFSELSKGDDYNVEWIKDEEVSICMCCQATEFNFYRRKHHCRACGNVVCGTCSGGRSKVEGLYGLQRICDECEYSMATKNNLPLARLSEILTEEQSNFEPETNVKNLEESQNKLYDELDNQNEDPVNEEVVPVFPMLHSPNPPKKRLTIEIVNLKLEEKLSSSSSKNEKNRVPINSSESKKIKISHTNIQEKISRENKDKNHYFSPNVPNCGSCIIF